MNQPTITIDAPELNNEGVSRVQAFLNEILIAFDSHYHHRLYRFHCRPIKLPVPNESSNPFIIIDALKLNDEGISNVRAFLLEIVLSFRSHHYHRRNPPLMMDANLASLD
jgi:hypothetical protein